MKLFYQESHKYGCYVFNWGASKGMDHFQDVCVVLSDRNWNFYLGGSVEALPAQTRNKLYVACSRARGNLYLVHDKHFRAFKATRPEVRMCLVNSGGLSGRRSCPLLVVVWIQPVDAHNI